MAHNICSLATAAASCLQNCTSNFSARKTCKNNKSAWFCQRYFPPHTRRSLSDSRSSANLILHLISTKSSSSPRALCSRVKEALAEAGKLRSVIWCNAMLRTSWTSLGSGGSRDRSALHSSWTNQDRPKRTRINILPWCCAVRQKMWTVLPGGAMTLPGSPSLPRQDLHHGGQIRPP